jgi:DHA1 family bicyclomycin/chloramphenicol resistance-like MFS transporter
MTSPSRIPRAPHPVRLAALLALLAMFGPFTIDAFFPAFNAVAKALGASPWQMQQTISVYLWAYAVMSLFHGPLSDAYGRRRVILVGVVTFTAASIGCATAHSIEALLAYRALQGVSTGAGMIVGRAIVRDCFEGPQAQKVMSLITLFFGVAPAIAPVVGAGVFKLSGWHAVFWFLALYGALLWLLCLRVLPETLATERRVPFNARTLLRTYGGIVADARYMLLAAATGFNFGAFFLYISSAPRFVEDLLGLGTLGYPWFFVPCIAGMMAGAALSNRLAGRLAPRATVKLGYALFGAGTAINLAYNVAVDALTVPWAVLPVALTSLGISLAFPTLTLKMLDRYPMNRGAASSMHAFITGTMMGLIAGVMSALVADSGLRLALGAAALAALGFACWLAYAWLTPVAIEAPESTPVLEEPPEPA